MTASQITIFNCNSNYFPDSSKYSTLQIWVLDHTAQTPWQNVGSLAVQYDAFGYCPGVGQPVVVPLTDGHVYLIVCVDEDLTGCGTNDPTVVGCQRAMVVVQGSQNGSNIPWVVS